MASEGYHEDGLSESVKDHHRAIISRSWRSSRPSTGTTSASTPPTDTELAAILAHNRDEEKEHAAMTLSGSAAATRARRDAAHLPLHRGVDPRGREHRAGEPHDRPCRDGSLGIGSLKGITVMNHLLRDLAPLTAEAWEVVDDEARTRLTALLAARKLVDFAGPHGWQRSAIELGRASTSISPTPALAAKQRVVQPLVELRAPFTLPALRARRHRPRRRSRSRQPRRRRARRSPRPRTPPCSTAIAAAASPA